MKALKIIGVVLAVIVAAIVAIPTFFADEVGNFAKKMVNQYIKDATVDFKDFSLSIVSSFPNLTAGIEGIDIIGTGRFEGDTLLHVGKLYADLDLMKAIGGEIQVNSVEVDDVLAQAIVTADSLVNWDIVALESDTTATEETVADTIASAPLKLNLQSLELSNIRVAYIDSAAKMGAAIDNLGLTMSATMNGNVADVDLKLGIGGVSATMDGTNYLSGAPVDFDAKVHADLDSMKVAFDKNQLTFAGLPLAFDGWVQLCDSDAIDMDIKLAALETTFKTVLDLVPEEMLKSVEGLQTKGSFMLYALAKGELKGENLPEFRAGLKVDDGYVKYPDLPKDLKNINISVLVQNPGGSVDLTTVAVDTFHFALGGSPFDITAEVKTPTSNMTIGAAILGKLNLGDLTQALPLEGMKIEGIMDADLKVQVDMKSLDEERFEDIKALGKLGLTNFKFQGDILPQGLDITQALLTFSPKAVNLNPLEIQLGKSDISMKGNVENYLPYVLRDGTIKGSVILNSHLLDCNELLTLATSEPADTTSASAEQGATTTTAASEPLKLPTNIDFLFNTDIDKLVFDKLELANINGRITLANGVADLSNLSSDICDGKLGINGKFQTPDGQNPEAKLKLQFTDVDINKLTGSFSVVDSVLPIARSAYGKVSIGLDVTTEIDSEMNLVMKSVNGDVNFASSSIELKESDFQNKLAKALNNDKYKDLKIKDCKVKCNIENGNIAVQPFNLSLFNHTSTFSGNQGLDGSMDYKLSMPIERSEIQELISKTGISLGSSFASGTALPVNVKIGGSLSDVQIKLDLSEATAQLAKETKAKVEDKATEAVDKAIDNIKDEKTKEAVTKAKDALNNLFKKK